MEKYAHTLHSMGKRIITVTMEEKKGEATDYREEREKESWMNFFLSPECQVLISAAVCHSEPLLAHLLA